MMQTLREAHAGPDAYYYGVRPDWLIVSSRVVNDPDLALESNMETMYNRLSAINPDAVDYEYSRHWVCGRIEMLVIDPNATNVVHAANEMIRYIIEEYPILDDDDYSQREYNYWTDLHADHIEREYADRECPFCCGDWDYIPESENENA